MNETNIVKGFGERLERAWLVLKKNVNLDEGKTYLAFITPSELARQIDFRDCTYDEIIGIYRQKENAQNLCDLEEIKFYYDFKYVTFYIASSNEELISFETSDH